MLYSFQRAAYCIYQEKNIQLHSFSTFPNSAWQMKKINNLEYIFVQNQFKRIIILKEII